MGSLTPLLKQYKSIKDKYKDTILLFRVGDFYETFYEDAHKTSKILNITLTSRPHGKNQRIPLAGVPVKAADVYISKLVKEGNKVAICEQLEEPGKGKKIVARDVVEVITPGTIMRETLLNARENNFIAALCKEGDKWGLAYADITTGDFFAGETNQEAITELERISPKEVILPSDIEMDIKFSKTFIEPYRFDIDIATSVLKKHFNIVSLDGFGLQNMPASIRASGALFYYLEETQKGALPHIKRIRILTPDKYMLLDGATLKNLEIFKNTSGGTERTLISILDKTLTPMGARLLRNWVLYPLLDPDEIKLRQYGVSEFFIGFNEREKLRKLLREISDIERITGRISAERASPRDIVALKYSLKILPSIINLLSGFKSKIVKSSIAKLNPPEEVINLIEIGIVDDPPVSIQEGGIIRKGYSKELDRLKDISHQGKNWITHLQEEERKRTGIQSLKVGYNTVFGYYIEITKPNLKYVPENYIRKQTLTNAERFITPELKEYESQVLGAEEKIKEMEKELFIQIRKDIDKYTEKIEEISHRIGVLDVISTFSEIAEEYNYKMPVVNDGSGIYIKNGRHPVVELIMEGNEFIPNDTEISPEKRIIILTGPNMAGKSTYLRQTALIVLLAQIGSFVPADECEVGIIDRIFTRIGASDDLSRGVSTFLAEMMETANIINNASSRTLAILDEVGRGTSTYDGLSIAWAMVEYLALMKEKPFVLFATHYHELTETEKYFPVIENLTVLVKETQEGVVFLRKVAKGKANKSYGVEVAKLAGLPAPLIERAKEILEDLREDDRITRRHPPRAQQLSLFQNENKIVKKIKEIDIASLSPREAINFLFDLKEEAEKS